MIIKKWKIVESSIEFKAHVFRYKKVKAESPNTHAIGTFDIVECLNWVNVIALTKNQEIVFVRQYRYGTDEVTTELPGGAIDFNEDPFDAAKRELREESGYTSSNWKKLGKVAANPAFMSNYCHTYLALDAEKTHELELDPFEEIEVVKIPKTEVMEKLTNGEINHSLIIAAFLFFFAAAAADPSGGFTK